MKSENVVDQLEMERCGRLECVCVDTMVILNLQCVVSRK